MKSIAEGLGIEKIYTLANASPQVGAPIGVKTTPEITRVDLKELELIYLKNATVFSGINKITQTIMAAGYELKCKNKKILAKYNKFLDNIGNTGSDITWDELLTQIYKFQCIYGRSWIENIFNTRGNRIVDLDIIDPKKMDYAKKGIDKIALDKFGRPVGYVETLPFGEISLPKGDTPPAAYNISLQPNQIYVDPKRICQFKLFTIGDGFYAIGLIEPAYNPALWKLNVEKGLANFIYISGFPTRIAYVGDANHEPTPQQVTNVLSKMTGLSYKQNMALPYYNKVELLEAQRAEKMREHLEYFKEQEVAAMGIPKPFATGAGEATNRATLSSQDRLFRLTLKDIIRRTCATLKKYVFAPIARLEGYPAIPDLVWGEIEEAGLPDKAERLAKYVKAGILKADPKLEAYIRKIEKLDE